MLENRCEAWMVGIWLLAIAALPAMGSAPNDGQLAEAEAVVTEPEAAGLTDAERAATAPEEPEVIDPVAAGLVTREELQRYDDLDSKRIQDFTNVDLADYVELRNRGADTRNPRGSAAEEIGCYAIKSLKQPYRAAAGRFDLAESDCVTFQERCIALGLATDWRSYHLLCNRLRHKDGVLKYANRNVYPLADWIPNNAWLFEDITDKLGVPASTFDLGLQRKKRLVAQIAAGRIAPADLDVDVASMPETELVPQTYVARKHVAKVCEALRTGDLVFVIRRKQAKGTAPWYFCDHVGVIFRSREDTVTIVHAVHPNVHQEPLIELMTRCPWVGGFKFVRLRDDAAVIADAELRRIHLSLPTVQPSEQDVSTAALRSARGIPLRQAAP
ncbi:MAG: DUF1460 domain-containing protein [Phycisphaerae bacterium]|nr:DUF1460 domain-containing protein [Phycisphaerae bacterium]